MAPDLPTLRLVMEINEFIIGFMQNGVYVTLTNRFDIHALKNPFAVSFTWT